MGLPATVATPVGAGYPETPRINAAFERRVHGAPAIAPSVRDFDTLSFGGDDHVGIQGLAGPGFPARRREQSSPAL